MFFDFALKDCGINVVSMNQHKWGGQCLKTSETHNGSSCAIHRERAADVGELKRKMLFNGVSSLAGEDHIFTKNTSNQVVISLCCCN